MPTKIKIAFLLICVLVHTVLVKLFACIGFQLMCVFNFIIFFGFITQPLSLFHHLTKFISNSKGCLSAIFHWFQSIELYAKVYVHVFYHVIKL